MIFSFGDCIGYTGIFGANTKAPLPLGPIHVSVRSRYRESILRGRSLIMVELDRFKQHKHVTSHWYQNVAQLISGEAVAYQRSSLGTILKGNELAGEQDCIGVIRGENGFILIGVALTGYFLVASAEQVTGAQFLISAYVQVNARCQ